MNIVNVKDLEWSKLEHLPAASPESENAKEIINLPKKKVSLAKKVSVFPWGSIKLGFTII